MRLYLSAAAVCALLVSEVLGQASYVDLTAEILQDPELPTYMLVDPATLTDNSNSSNAYTAMLANANAISGVSVGNENENDDVHALACALVWARTGTGSYRTDVLSACADAIDSQSENDANVSAAGRNIPALCMAANIVGGLDGGEAAFRAWLLEVVYRDRLLANNDADNVTLVEMHGQKASNISLHCGTARLAAAIYLGDAEEIQAVARVFYGWCDPDNHLVKTLTYNFTDQWFADANDPSAIGRVGTSKSGVSLDGCLGYEMGRPDTDDFSTTVAGATPWEQNYAYEALQGAVVTAVLLERQGYDASSWGTSALQRAYLWLQDVAEYPAEGDDLFLVPLVNWLYGTSYTVDSGGVGRGKNCGYSDWFAEDL